MTKQQLVEEYLQLEGNYDQLSQRLKTETTNLQRGLRKLSAENQSEWRRGD